MLYMIKSNKMEGLMDGLAAVLAQVPDDPMGPEWIGIQSRGMKQWITTQVAEKFGICANLSFLFPRQMIELFFSSRDTRQNPLLSEDVLMWSIMETILENCDNPCFSSLQNYIAQDATGSRLFQLSVKIARLFDDYQIYRPEMLLDWEKSDGKTSFSDPVMGWQSMLWRQICASWPHTHMAARLVDFAGQAAPVRQGTLAYSERPDKATDKKTSLPQRISLFGVSAMPPRFLDLFGALAQTMDIFLFLLTPSDQFFFDIKSRRELEKMDLDHTTPPDPESYYEIANPLLASLGRSGRDFHGSLERFDYHEPLGDLFEDPLDRSSDMLAILQSDIMNLVFRKVGSDTLPVAVDPGDASICIHACHSPMREAQVLKDLLLEAFEADPDLCPHEVIVMMPDIEAYAPYIEAVFSSEHSLPFSISDRRKKSESQTLEAFLKILGLKDSRLEQARVLDLLLSPAIAAKFDILAEELLPIEEMVRASGILWGRDGAHRKELTDAGFDENTWMFGFKRLFMGYGLAEGVETLVEGVLPCDMFEGLEARILGKVVHFGFTLFGGLTNLSAPKTIENWGKSFQRLVLSMMEKTHANEADIVFLLQTIDDFIRDGEMAGYGRKIEFAVARDIIEGKLDKRFAQGSFLAGSLTFCNLMPMRSIPFKVVVLMGMDEQSFPRKSVALGFDLIKKYPQIGDKQEREEDRYLFLESLLSARNRLIITYTGMSIKDNSPIPCSGVVEELKDVMLESFEFPENFLFCFHHPLHPFSPVYFSQPDFSQPGFSTAGSFFSFSQDQCRIALSQAVMEKKDAPEQTVFLPRDFCLDPATGTDPKKGMDLENKINLVAGMESDKMNDRATNAPEISSLTLADLVRFFRNPVQAFVTQGLNLSFAEIEEPAPDREVFQLSGLSRYGLGSYYMEKETKTDLYPLVRAGGLLPFGQKGKSEWDRVKALGDPIIALADTMDPGQPVPSLWVDTQVGDFQVTGSITDLYEEGRFLAGFGRVTPARLLTQWIYHLFLNGQISLNNLASLNSRTPLNDPATHGQPCHTRIIGQDPKGKLPAVAYSFSPMVSQPHIDSLIDLYQRGQNQPLAFFCDTSFHLAQSLAKKNYEQSRENLELALSQSRRFWSDRFYGGGEGMNRYVSLVFGASDPFENMDNFIESGIVDNALKIYKPLLENLTCP